MTIRRGIPPLLIGLTLLLSACSQDATPKVQIGEARHAPVSEVVEAPATVGARATATLRSSAAGTVTKLYVHDGDTVDKGEILAKISSTQAEDQLKQARQAERQASRPVRLGGGVAAPAIRFAGLNATSSLDRKVARGFTTARTAARKIKDAQVRTQLLAAIDGAETQHRAQRAALNQITQGLTRSVNQVLSQVSGQIGAGLGGLASSMSSLQAASKSQAKAAVKIAESTVKGLVIKAPFDGVVTLGGPSGGGSPSLGSLLGQLPAGLAGQAGTAAGSSGGAGASTSGGTVATGVPVAAGDAIATVTDVSRLTLSADVDETDVLLVTPGTKAEVELDAVSGAAYRAKVTGVGVTPKEGTTGGVSYPVRLTLGQGAYDDGGDAPVPKPGMSAVVRLTVRESPDAVAVPASSIVTSGRETVVWVVRADGSAERRVVKLGAQGDAVVEVARGLSSGERVVVKGADTVRPGQKLT